MDAERSNQSRRGLIAPPSEIVGNGFTLEQAYNLPQSTIESIPPGLRMALLWSEARITTGEEIAHSAIKQTSEVYEYAAFKAASSLQMAGLLRQAAQFGGWLTPEMEREIACLTLDYLKAMHAVTGEANEAILGVLHSLADGSREPGLWDTLVLWLRTH